MQFSRFPTETTQRLFILPVTQPVMDLECFRLKACLPEPVRYFGNHMLKIFLVFTEDKHFLYLFRKITPDQFRCTQRTAKVETGKVYLVLNTLAPFRCTVAPVQHTLYLIQLVIQIEYALHQDRDRQYLIIPGHRQRQFMEQVPLEIDLYRIEHLFGTYRGCRHSQYTGLRIVIYYFLYSLSPYLRSEMMELINNDMIRFEFTDCTAIQD